MFEERCLVLNPLGSDSNPSTSVVGVASIARVLAAVDRCVEPIEEASASSRVGHRIGVLEVPLRPERLLSALSAACGVPVLELVPSGPELGPTVAADEGVKPSRSLRL